MEKNVIVNDENGKIIGSTYLRRAKGLVKNNRAAWVDDSQQAVILSCPPDIVEEDNIMENTEIIVNAANVMMNKDLFFNPREWSFNSECENNKGERCFIDDSSGEFTEVYCLGDWGWNWSEIVSKPYALSKDSRYTFTFWLNGGENDCNNETCQLRILFGDDKENCNIYKLNRNFIKPKKHIDGWYLYEIPFDTGDNDVVRLKFSAMRAPMAVKTAKALRDYAGVESTPIPENKPQRHNIVFADGWEKERTYQNGGNGNANYFCGNASFSSNGFAEQIREQIFSEIDIDDICDDIRESLGENLAEQIKKQVRDSFNENNS